MIKHTYMGHINISQFDSHRNRDTERWKWRSEARQKLLPTENLLQNPSKKNCNRLLYYETINVNDNEMNAILTVGDATEVGSARQRTSLRWPASHNRITH
jgi:hypothetical protein